MKIRDGDVSSGDAKDIGIVVTNCLEGRVAVQFQDQSQQS